MTVEKSPERATPPHLASVPPEGKAGRAKAAPPEDDTPKLPTLRELEEELGDAEGCIRLDVNLETGEAKKVKVDAKGKESR